MNKPPSDEFAPRRPRWRRILMWTVLGLVVLLGLGAALLPWALETSPARRMILAAVDDFLAPGKLRVDRFHFSYFGPTRMENFVIVDPGGGEPLRAKEAILDRTLVDLLLMPSGAARGARLPVGLKLSEAQVDLQRTADGNVNLADALQALLEGDPAKKVVDLSVDLPGWAGVRVRDEALPEPFEARMLSGSLHVPDHGGAATWDFRLRSSDQEDAPKLDLRGKFCRLDRGDEHDGDLDLEVQVDRWPVQYDAGPVGLSMTASAGPTVRRRAGVWTGAGDLNVVDLDVRGLSEQLDAPLHCERLSGRLELTEAVAPTGENPSRGTGLSLRLDAEKGVGGPSVLAEHVGEGAWGLEINGNYWPSRDRADLSTSRLTLPIGSALLVGRVSDLSKPMPVVDLTARIAPDDDRVAQVVAARLGPGYTIDGAALEVHATGPVKRSDPADVAESLGIEGTFSFDSLTAAGLRVGSTRTVARLEKAEWKVEPIVTTVNGGTLRVQPAFEPAKDGGSMLLVLDEGTSLQGAEINEELSRRVLSYAVPILEQATHPTGTVSAAVEKATIPLLPPGTEGPKPEIEAAIVFEDVEFGPGPLAMGILDLFGKRNVTLKLDQPVHMVATGGRIYTEGVSVPLVGDVLRFEIDGSVGIQDETLDLVARVPITQQMLGNLPVLTDVFEGSSVEVPIRGTFDQPKLDKLAFEGNLDDVAGSVLRGLGRGLNGLGDIFGRMRDRRMQRRGERRGFP